MFGTCSWISSCQGQKTGSHSYLARQVATLVRNASQSIPPKITSPVWGAQVRTRPTSWSTSWCLPRLSSTSLPRSYHQAQASRGANIPHGKRQGCLKGDGVNMPSGGMTVPHNDKGPLLPGLWQGCSVVFPRVSQNIAAAATLLDKLPKTKTSSE
jgi:hypothetical protein